MLLLDYLTFIAIDKSQSSKTQKINLCNLVLLIYQFHGISCFIERKNEPSL